MENGYAAKISRPTLERLIHPCGSEDFFRDYWEKEPLVVARAAADYYDSILTRSDVDELLSTSSMNSPEIRVVKDGSSLSISELARVNLATNAFLHEALVEQYRSGATIVINSANERWPPLGSLCVSLGREFSGAFQANVYITPRNAQGFAAHYDTHDVIVLQIAGSKAWKLYDDQVSILPLRDDEHMPCSVTPQDPHRRIDLYAGDCAYIPRGWVHEAASQESGSIHVTLGIHTLQWADVILGATTAAFRKYRGFRESVPPGFVADPNVRAMATDQLLELAELLSSRIHDGAVLMEDAALAADRGGQRVARGRLNDLEHEHEITTTTCIRRRQEIQYETGVTEDSALLSFNGKVLAMPLRVARDLAFIVEADEFTPMGLPGGLDDLGRVTLVRRLVQEGFLELSRPLDGRQ